MKVIGAPTLVIAMRSAPENAEIRRAHRDTLLNCLEDHYYPRVVLVFFTEHHAQNRAMRQVVVEEARTNPGSLLLINTTGAGKVKGWFA